MAIRKRLKVDSLNQSKKGEAIASPFLVNDHQLPNIVRQS
jgi:hypothetical protein